MSLLIRGVEYDKLFKTLEYKSTLSYLNISQLEGHERTEKILGLIEVAGSVYDNFIPGIRQAMQDSIDRFRNGGYKNVWLFKRKRIDRVGQVELICELDREMFTLTLVAKNKNTEIYRRDILKTKPSSVIYHHKFKDVLVDENDFVIIDRFGKPIYQVSISDVTRATDLQ